jgi:hypothetical protein
MEASVCTNAAADEPADTEREMRLERAQNGASFVRQMRLKVKSARAAPSTRAGWWCWSFETRRQRMKRALHFEWGDHTGTAISYGST